MRFLSPVVWSEGMHLAPHHFQAQSRFFEESRHFALSAVFPEPYGLVGLELDEEALRNGTVSLIHARGLMPDGLPFNFPHDPPPEPLRLEDLFSPTAQAHEVLLAIPRYVPSGANCTPPESGGPQGSRYVAGTEQVLDMVAGQDEKEVSIAHKNFRLILDVEDEREAMMGGLGGAGAPPKEGRRPGSSGSRTESVTLENPGIESGPAGDELITLPLARVRRDGAGSFVYDSEFLPPCLQIGASRKLVRLLQRLVDALQARADALRSQRSAAGPLEMGGSSSELVDLWLGHAISSHLPVLRHHLATRSAHPERLFSDLAGLAGALGTFSLAGDAGSLPSYLPDPEAAFQVLEREIKSHLHTLAPSNVVKLRVEPRDQYFHTASVVDRRVTSPKAHWFLGVRSGIRRDKLIEGVPRVVKVCSAKFIDRLVREAFPGLALEHSPSPPKGVAPRVGMEYFRVRKEGPCWVSITDSGGVGVYTPAALSDPELELVVVLEGESV